MNGVVAVFGEQGGQSRWEVLVDRSACGNQPDHSHDRDPQSTDAGTALERVGLNGDAFERHVDS